MSQTTLALLIALITVVSSAGPGLYAWLTPARSKLRPEFKQIYKEFLELYLFNDGNQNGHLFEVTLRATTKGGREMGPLSLEIDHTGSIPPGEPSVVQTRVHFEKQAEFVLWPHREVTGCTLDVRVADHREPPRIVSVPCSLDAFHDFCKATEGAAIEWKRVQPLLDKRGQRVSRCS